VAADHVLLVGFGGPEKPEDVEPFLRNVARGRQIPEARLREVKGFYERVGGSSPYNACAFRLAGSLKGPLPVFVGMRNWRPFLADTLSEIGRAGLKKGIGVVLAPHRSESSFDRYVKDVEEACRASGQSQLTYDYVPPWHDHPLFIEAQAGEVKKVLARLPEGGRRARLIFSAHSIPVKMARRSSYEEEYRRSSELVAAAVGADQWSLGYQSRSGDPRDPWLEPHILSILRDLADRGEREAVLVPLGFLFDHVEILYDLDVAARETAEKSGLHYGRAATVGAHPKFAELLSSLIEAGRW
jgi:ferrochelatase